MNATSAEMETLNRLMSLASRMFNVIQDTVDDVESGDIPDCPVILLERMLAALEDEPTMTQAAKLIKDMMLNANNLEEYKKAAKNKKKD